MRPGGWLVAQGMYYAVSFHLFQLYKWENWGQKNTKHLESDRTQRLDTPGSEFSHYNMQILRKGCVTEEAKVICAIFHNLSHSGGRAWNEFGAPKVQERQVGRESSKGMQQPRSKKGGDWGQAGFRGRYFRGGDWLQEWLQLARLAVQWTSIGHRTRGLLDEKAVCVSLTCTDKEYLP